MIPAIYGTLHIAKQGVSIARNGYQEGCPAPEAGCSCETSLYATVGTLAFIGGISQWLVGYYRSMAVLSDSLHALADAGADFWGMYIARKVYANNQTCHTSRKEQVLAKAREIELRRVGNKVIAILLALGALIVGYEAIERWYAGTYLVSPLVIILAGTFGLAIDLMRCRILIKAIGHYSSNENLFALIDHAKSDAIHSAIIASIGMVATAGTLLPIDRGAYLGGVRVVDFAASLALAGYMLFYLSWKIWRGQACGDAHRRAYHHEGPCDHHHH